MKRYLKTVQVALMAILMMVALSGCGSSKSSTADKDYDNSYCVDGKPSAFLQQLREADTLVVGSSGDAPFAYIDSSTGDFDGVDAAIVTEIAHRLGIDNVEMKNITFSELILNLNNDNIDMITDCMYATADRAKNIYFGNYWYTQGPGLLVGDDSGISSIDDFDPNSTVIGYTPGTSFQTVVEGWADQGLIKEARSTGDQTESITALQYGKIDGFLTDSTVLEYLFTSSPKTVDGLELASDFDLGDDYIGHISPAVTFDHKDFMVEVNNVLQELRDEGFITQVFEDYGLTPSLHIIDNDDDTICDVNTQ